MRRCLEMGNEKAELRKQSTTLPKQAGRIIVFDTETTGFSKDDCLIEIGAVELLNGEITGVNFHSYVNARRKSHSAALKVHGLTPQFLSKFRTVDRVLKSFMNWVGDARLIAHNAAFDSRMLNYEFERLKRPLLPEFRVFCTAKWYRDRYPGQPYNLDAVC